MKTGNLDELIDYVLYRKQLVAAKRTISRFERQKVMLFTHKPCLFEIRIHHQLSDLKQIAGVDDAA